jgi:hypothetical protein
MKPAAFRDHLSLRSVAFRKSKTVRPGVDVMSTIFGDFFQFSAKKIGGLHKNQCHDQNFA